MSTIDHGEAMSLLAARAIDALRDDERAALDQHVEQCAECREQLDAYDETAARLAPEVAPAPEVWGRLAAQLEPRVVPIAARRRTKLQPLWIGAAAAVIALAVGIGVGLRAGDEAAPSVEELATAARDEEGSTVLTLLSEDGAAAAEAVLTADGRGYLTNETLPDLDPDRGYQLWALQDGQPLSVALLGDDPTVEAFRVPSELERLVITDEPSTGSQSPTTVAVASAAT